MENRRVSGSSLANILPVIEIGKLWTFLDLFGFLQIDKGVTWLARIVLTSYMMMFRASIVAFLTLAGLCSTVQAKVLDIQLSSKKGQVSSWKMNDGYTMMALVKPAVDGLEEALSLIHISEPTRRS